MEEKKGAPRPPAERPVSCGAHDHHASIRISITPRNVGVSLRDVRDERCVGTGVAHVRTAKIRTTFAKNSRGV